MSKPRTLPQVEPFYVLIGQRMKHVREFLGKRQEDVAAKCGLTRTSVVNIEAGRQRFPAHFVEIFAKALGVKPKKLLREIWT